MLLLKASLCIPWSTATGHLQTWLTIFILQSVCLPPYCLLTQSFIHSLLYTLSLSYYTLLTAWIIFFLLLLLLSLLFLLLIVTTFGNKIFRSISVYHQTQSFSFYYIELSCFEKLLHIQKVCIWADSKLSGHWDSSPAQGTLTPRSFSSPSPLATAAADIQSLSYPSPHFPMFVVLQLWPLPFFHCNCHPNQHPGPNYFLSISPSFAISCTQTWYFRYGYQGDYGLS